MKNLIPHDIARAFAENKKEGVIKANSLFLDISGFTKMTETLMGNGKNGAETLSRIINSVFEPILQELYSAGGFVTTFAGDAFTALFPDTSNLNPDQVRDCAIRIMGIFTNNPIHRTLWGEFFLQAKIGLSAGSVEWGILSAGESLGYYFKGEAIDGCANAEHQCEPGMIALQKELGYTVPSDATLINKNKPDTNYQVFRPGPIPQTESPHFSAPQIPVSVIQRFLPFDKFPETSYGEFRSIVSVFILFDESKTPLQDVFNSLVETTQENGGFLNLLDFGDKGGVALVLFGAPVSLEKKEKRAFDFSLQLHARQPLLKIGIAMGSCFTGYVGGETRSTYTALGETVNLSARIAYSAKPGEILLPKSVFVQWETDYQIDSLDYKSFKGISQPIQIGLLKKQKLSRQQISLPRGFGRNEEQEELKGWILSTLKVNRVQSCVLSGEMGIGKTQTINDVLLSLGDQVFYILFQFDTVFQKSFGPLRKYFKELFNSIELQNGETLKNIFQKRLDDLVNENTPDFIKSEIDRVAPPLYSLAGLKITDEDFLALDVQARHDRTIEALASYFSLLALSSPFVFIIDQAQSMDEASLKFFKLLQTHTSGLSLGLIFLFRGEHIDGLSFSIDKHIALQPFSSGELITAVEQIYHARPVQNLIDFLEKRTNAIPLYLFALISFLKNNHLIAIDKGSVSLKDTKGVALPKSLEDLLLSQIDSLPKKIKSALPLLAVLGNSFPVKIAYKMLGVDAAALLEQLLKHEILVQDSEDNYFFQKEIIQMALYQLQLNDYLKIMHKQAAESFTNLFPEKKEFSQEKAYHFFKADELTIAKDYFLYSAEEAKDNFFNTLALEQYKQFLSLSQDELKNSVIRLERAQIMELTGDWNDAILELEHGMGLATIGGDQSLYHKIFNLMGQIKFRQGKTGTAKDYFEKAISSAEHISIDPEMVQSRIDLARTYIIKGQYEDARVKLDEAREMAQQNHYIKEEGLSLYYLGQVFSSRNQKDDAKQYYHSSLDIFRSLKNPRLIASPLYDLSLMAQNKGELDLSRVQMKETMDLYVQIGYKSGIAAALLNLGLMEDQVGDFSKGRDFFRRSRNIAEELGEDLGVGYAQFCQGASSFKGAELAQAINYLDEAQKIFQRLHADSYLGYTLSYLSSTLVRMGRGDEAVSSAYEQMKIIQKTGTDVEKGRIFLALAELLEKKIPVNPDSNLLIKQISDMAGLKSPSVEQFYIKALNSSKKSHYVNTLIPGLFYYGEYLIKEGKKEMGIKYIIASYNESKSSSWKYFMKSIKEKYQDIFV